MSYLKFSMSGLTAGLCACLFGAFSANAPADELDAAPVSTAGSAYAVTGAGTLGTLNLATGVFAELGSSGDAFAGLGVANGRLFAVNYHQADGTLYSIDTGNGAATVVGKSTVEYELFGSTTAGGLYALGTDGDLYSVHAATGAATLIGPVGLSGIGAAGSWYSLSTNSPALYLSDGTDLYTLNTRTGAATLVGKTGGPELGSVMFESGTLWGVEGTPKIAVATVNPATGAVTSGAVLSGKGVAQIWGLAPSPIPLVATKTSLTATASATADGATLSLTALVTPTDGTTTPTGSVSFKSGTTVLGSKTLNGTGQATLTTAALPLGKDSVEASYSGDAYDASSTSGAVSVTVSPDATTTTLAAAPASTTYGTAIVLTATVKNTSGGIKPAGTVSFVSGSKTLGTAKLSAAGTASLSVSTLPVGTHSIFANYAGDAADQASGSKVTQVTVLADPTTTTLSASPTTAGLGATIKFTATVKPAAGAKAPTGTVSFKSGTTVLGTATLGSTGTATLSVATLSAGAHTVTAVYSGSATEAASTSAAVTVTITTSVVATTTTLVASPTSAPYGTLITLVATVKPASGAKVPTGTVTFVSGNAEISLPVNSAGVATFSTQTLKVGTHTAIAKYSGDSTDAPSTSNTVTVTIT